MRTYHCLRFQGAVSRFLRIRDLTPNAAVTVNISTRTLEGESAVRSFATLFQHLARRLAVIALGFSLVACGSVGGNHPPAPVQAGGAEYSYLIGPGDTLTINVSRNPELSISVPVRPDGKISTPLVEDLVAQGKSAMQLGREIEKRLEKYVRDPVVTVIVTNFVGAYSEQVRVVGEAARPQSLPFRHRMTLLDVMIAVGGLTDFAAGNRATIMRTSEGNKQYSVRLKDLVKNGDVSANVEMRPGDIVIIPQSLF